ncbi:MAG TPA: hypothetical protein VFV67_26735 [Actinophytocola sp.]|uniref:hypothetical protein n=1 Tax=Actinophytocola sp. TaxID=1872138 RepID=UPI002DBC801F|nr:hypothetical protein [Actinophytocola sp.]HEU5474260.1 hypothetical protein [Actinophytocola sp.]
MSDFNPDSSALSAKLKGWLPNSGLSGDQQTLLRAMLGVARGITDAGNGSDAPNLTRDFDHAFDPLTTDKVNLLLKYRNGSPAAIVYEEPPTATDNGYRAATPRIVRSQPK